MLFFEQNSFRDLMKVLSVWISTEAIESGSVCDYPYTNYALCMVSSIILLSNFEFYSWSSIILGKFYSSIFYSSLLL